LFFGSIPLKHGRHFNYWNHPLNIGMRVWHLDCHETGLCYYLMIHIENLLLPLQLFYFHLWPIYWLCLVSQRRPLPGNAMANMNRGAVGGVVAATREAVGSSRKQRQPEPSG
jgi:hypothetical protein